MPILVFRQVQRSGKFLFRSLGNFVYKCSSKSIGVIMGVTNLLHNVTLIPGDYFCKDLLCMNQRTQTCNVLHHSVYLAIASQGGFQVCEQWIGSLSHR